MKPLTFSLHASLVLIFLLFVTTSVSLKVPRLSPTGGTFLHGNSWTQGQPSDASRACDLKHFRPFYYNQTLDHFNFRPDSFNTFQQRYFINSKHWNSSNISAPILAYLGAEEEIRHRDICNIGFLPENAFHFQALQIYIEHRYYGASIPFGREEANKNPSTLGYFNSAQAIADYAEILIHVKKQLHAENSPVIVVGGSYGGMLASWFRLKYPHVALGALASSAPILYFDDIVPPETGYYSIVSRDFREASETCYQIIKKSWTKIDDIASKPEGLSILAKIFHTCCKLSSSSELKDYLRLMYASAAQYDSQTHLVTAICGAIDGASSTNDTLKKIFAGVVAYYGNQSCYVNQARNEAETDGGWTWQRCSDMVMPISGVSNNTMFPPYKFDLDEYIDDCKELYGVPPRPHWVTTYYGGHNIKLTLKRFASNIIFSNGLRDPYSSGGVLNNISDTVVAVLTKNGSHCLDILPSYNDDPDWLVHQRKTEVGIIEGWIAKYSADLQARK